MNLLRAFIRVTIATIGAAIGVICIGCGAFLLGLCVFIFTGWVISEFE